jgi:hypothetical protein
LFIVDSRIVIRQHEASTGIPARETDRLDGREVEKITVFLPPETRASFGPDPTRYCAHRFNPKRHLLLSGTEFRSRVFWFDPETHLLLKRKCGCKPPNNGTHDEKKIEYPAPESVSRDLLTFEVPRGASLQVRDPQLGRPVYSEGQTESDLGRDPVRFDPQAGRDQGPRRPADYGTAQEIMKEIPAKTLKDLPAKEQGKRVITTKDLKKPPAKEGVRE